MPTPDSSESGRFTGRPEDGFRGIWYSNQPVSPPYNFKYSGGLGTYCAKHIPFAVYRPEVQKTFFCWGGRPRDRNILWHMASWFDHRTGRVARPVFLVDKQTDDAHDNPVIQMDAPGRIWIFSSSHGTARPSFIFRSASPYDISRFELVRTTNFSYPQPWFIPERGFVFLQTLYHGGRFLFSQRSADGVHWDDPVCYARIEEGHYQVSCAAPDGRIGTAFNYHPKGKGLNWRTNLYYMQTRDGGLHWETAGGVALDIPLRSPQNPALVHDFASEGWNVYMKDLNFDRNGNPIIFFLTSRGWRPGPRSAPHVFHTAHWNGRSWDIRKVAEGDNCYDTGCLHVESDGTWRVIAPTDPGPQPGNPGGEIVMWISRDQGASWTRIKRLTWNSRFNHNYCRRPVRAAPEFYAFWADGNPRAPSESHLYFTDREGTHVWRLPDHVEGETAEPEVAFGPNPE